MAEGDVFQSDAAGNFGGYAHFLADAVHQMELHFGEKDGKRDSRKASSRAEVHNLCSRLEADYLGYAQRMQHMVLVQVLDIFA